MRYEDLSEGIKHAVENMPCAAKRDGYDFQANIMLTDLRNGEELHLATRGGEWYEVEVVE